MYILFYINENLRLGLQHLTVPFCLATGSICLWRRFIVDAFISQPLLFIWLPRITIFAERLSRFSLQLNLRRYRSPWTPACHISIANAFCQWRHIRFSLHNSFPVVSFFCFFIVHTLCPWKSFYPATITCWQLDALKNSIVIVQGIPLHYGLGGPRDCNGRNSCKKLGDIERTIGHMQSIFVLFSPFVTSSPQRKAK